MKHDTTAKLKFELLRRRLNLRRWEARGLLDTLWAFTEDNCPRGDIGRFTPEQIAIGLDWQHDPEALVEALVAERWLDEHPEHGLVVHDWADHCELAVHTKLARATEHFATGERPKLTKFNREERQQIENAYAARETAEHQRTYVDGSAQERAGAAGSAPAPAPLPAPAPIPCRVPERRVPERREAGVSRNQRAGGRPSAFEGLTAGDLRDTPRLLAWYDQARRRSRPVVGSSDHERLMVLAAAERALEVGEKPVGLFATIVSGQNWHLISQDQERRAHARLVEHARPQRIMARDGDAGVQRLSEIIEHRRAAGA